MGRSPCCEKVGLKKGPWTPEEDQKLLAYIEEHGHGSWRVLPAKAGLQRCGKSCRLRWTNYLRPDIKRGKFNLEEEQTIIQLHALLGNRWSAIATHLPKRTDNEIKNYWNTHLKKRLDKMGIDPVTHKPKSDALSLVDGPTKNNANLSHMAQWESARLEAEARLVRESKLRSNSCKTQPTMSAGSDPGQNPLNGLKGKWSKSTTGIDLESPTSTWSSSENSIPIPTIGFGKNPTCDGEMNGGVEDLKGLDKGRIDDNSATWTAAHHDMEFTGQGPWVSESSKCSGDPLSVTNFIDGFADILLENADDRNSSDHIGHSNNVDGSDCEDDENKNYWNNILNLVNSSPLESPRRYP